MWRDTGFLKAAALADACGRPFSAHTAPALHLPACCACLGLRNIEWFHDHVRIEHLFDGVPRTQASSARTRSSGPGLDLQTRSDANEWRREDRMNAWRITIERTCEGRVRSSICRPAADPASTSSVAALSAENPARSASTMVAGRCTRRTDRTTGRCRSAWSSRHRLRMSIAHVRGLPEVDAPIVLSRRRDEPGRRCCNMAVVIDFSKHLTG